MIEFQMREQALREMQEADVLVQVRDERDPIDLPRAPDLVVQTKMDVRADRNVCPTHRGEGPEGVSGQTGVSAPAGNDSAAVWVSARTGEGMEALRARLDALAFGEERGESLALNARHVRAIDEARAALQRAGASIDAGAEVVALELREALDHLGAVLGKLSPDDVLGRVFAGFCIGK
jgi:tRNA modification GTPase